ncbi:MAG: sigma-70 family RNA polymerase sigma factor [Fulvivirga sp.]|nr:sigma-70 family RNA polymerase sigma factor [Fulvivirga sp.]
MTRKEESQLIESIIHGDVHAFSLLVDQYRDHAFTLALRIVKSREDAEEVSQDAFYKAYRHLKKFKHESSFSTWLYRIVYNTALSKIKKQRLQAETMEQAHLQIAEEHAINGLSDLVAADRKKYLNLAMERLPKEEASLLSLQYTQDKDMLEIAEITGLTHGNVRVKLTRARKKLFEKLSVLLKKELNSIR